MFDFAKLPQIMSGMSGMSGEASNGAGLVAPDTEKIMSGNVGRAPFPPDTARHPPDNICHTPDTANPHGCNIRPTRPTRPTQKQDEMQKPTQDAAEIPDESEPIKRECRTCEHLRKPGLSDGHCSGRDDLPRAYGKTHPLRECPEDGGASCTVWQLSRLYH